MRDADVRATMIEMLALSHAGEADTRIVQEMGVWSGTARVDIAVINGELCGFELKSARDTLSRLPSQISYFSPVFDRMTLVVAANHLEASRKVLPAWWGLMVVEPDDSRLRLRSIRSAKRNSRLCGMQLARLLWRDEALEILEKHGLEKGRRSKAAPILHEALQFLPLATLRDEVRLKLKLRENWLRQLT